MILLVVVQQENFWSMKNFCAVVSPSNPKATLLRILLFVKKKNLTIERINKREISILISRKHMYVIRKSMWR